MRSIGVVLSIALFVHAAASAQETKKAAEPKIYAKSPVRLTAGMAVIRSGEQLGKLQNKDADQATANLAKTLKVQAIDWKTQMVIVLSGGTQRTGGYSVVVQSLDVKDGKLTVNWKVKGPPPGSIVTQALTMPSLTILVDRFEGEVVFNPKSAPGAFGKKLGSD